MAPDNPRTRKEKSEYHMCAVEVTAVTQITPHLRRVTLRGDELGKFPDAGPDQRIKLILPAKGQPLPQSGKISVGKFMGIWARSLVRGPVFRTYTIRHHRPELAEIDIDFAIHGRTGPASIWALDTKPGDRVAVFGPASEYKQPAAHAWRLVIGDETAYPAIANIVAEMPSDANGNVLIEFEDAADFAELAAPQGVQVHQISRNGAPAHTSTRLHDALKVIEIPSGPHAVFIAAESSVIKELRRSLVSRGIDKSDIHFSGYWKFGKAIG